MPRDLASLVKGNADSEPAPEGIMFGAQAAHDSETSSKRNEVHPYTQTLTLRDVDACVVLEDLAFPPNERATRAKFQYRLGKCSELSLGIFTSSESSSIPTYASAAPVYSGAPNRKSVLLGHIVATKTNGSTVDDSDMGIPSDDPSDSSLGNKEEGRTVAIHSLAVLPEFQHKGLGSTIMKAYLDRLAKQDVADKAALIAHEEMIPYYEKFGFKNKGKSSAQFGGGGWFDMVKDISDDEKEDY